ncbi:spore protease YyaC [Jeotgalibacillus sp. S-D1]|uniref:spore protease YyaC n=1 Tax=Jeotgalibacillus sp. S-D1 TaxID=2552189 RepID=UPI001F0D4798|nr:spore protease YyaC [Jeotgalibacillus sp. S-D1]
MKELFNYHKAEKNESNIELIGMVDPNSTYYSGQLSTLQKALSIVMEKAMMEKRQCVFICIGSDRSVGDSLGPLTGTFLRSIDPTLNIYGTLEEPVHSFNLKSVYKKIKKTFFNPLIICIDASLAEKDVVGSVILNKGPIQPGSALKKTLLPIGDYHILGVVNYLDPLPSAQFLNDTRLLTVYSLSKIITKIISEKELF